MAKKQDLQISTLPEDLVLPILAGLRIFERGLNPAFYVHLKCGMCGEYGANAVPSVKKERTFIGIQCECGNTVKFERPLDMKAATVPDRLKNRPESALDFDGSKPPKVEKKWTQLAFKIASEE